jgi:hypothetical protein
MSSQTKEWSKLDWEAKETAGPPHLLAFMGLLMAIKEAGPTVGQHNFDKITEYLESATNMSTEELNDQVRLCKAAKCYNHSDKKLFLEMGRCPVRQHILAAVVQMGFKKKGGRAPPSHLERELGEWLEQL